MNRRPTTVRFLIAVSLALVLAAVTEGQTLKLPPHERITLKNGMTVLLMEKRGVPMVSFAAIVKAGSTADPMGQEGLASTTAGLLRKGTAQRSAQKFAEDLDFIGASFGADASDDFTALSAECLTKDLDKGLDLLSDAMVGLSLTTSLTCWNGRYGTARSPAKARSSARRWRRSTDRKP